MLNYYLLSKKNWFLQKDNVQSADLCLAHQWPLGERYSNKQKRRLFDLFPSHFTRTPAHALPPAVSICQYVQTHPHTWYRTSCMHWSNTRKNRLNRRLFWWSRLKTMSLLMFSTLCFRVSKFGPTVRWCVVLSSLPPPPPSLKGKLPD